MPRNCPGGPQQGSETVHRNCPEGARKLKGSETVSETVREEPNKALKLSGDEPKKGSETVRKELKKAQKLSGRSLLVSVREELQGPSGASRGLQGAPGPPRGHGRDHSRASRCLQGYCRGEKGLQAFPAASRGLQGPPVQGLPGLSDRGVHEPVLKGKEPPPWGLG